PHTLFKACSDPTRLRILQMLRGGELCVCDIVDILNVPQPKVSRHLAYLRRFGLVNARKNGLWIHYSLKSAGNALHHALLRMVDASANGSADSRKLARLRLAEKKRCS